MCAYRVWVVSSSAIRLVYGIENGNWDCWVLTSLEIKISHVTSICCRKIFNRKRSGVVKISHCFRCASKTVVITSIYICCDGVCVGNCVMQKIRRLPELHMRHQSSINIRNLVDASILHTNFLERHNFETNSFFHRNSHVLARSIASKCHAHVMQSPPPLNNSINFMWRENATCSRSVFSWSLPRTSIDNIVWRIAIDNESILHGRQWQPKHCVDSSSLHILIGLCIIVSFVYPAVQRRCSPPSPTRHRQCVYAIISHRMAQLDMAHEMNNNHGLQFHFYQQQQQHTIRYIALCTAHRCIHDVLLFSSLLKRNIIAVIINNK